MLGIVVGIINVLLMLAAGSLWLVGYLRASQRLKDAALIAFGLYAIVNLLTLVLAFSLGWFPFR